MTSCIIALFSAKSRLAASAASLVLARAASAGLRCFTSRANRRFEKPIIVTIPPAIRVIARLIPMTRCQSICF
ncbi:MAG: hypothetical protein GY850_07920 [bacterium]|nr:hypothetical protein [bacterium]